MKDFIALLLTVAFVTSMGYVFGSLGERSERRKWCKYHHTALVDYEKCLSTPDYEVK